MRRDLIASEILLKSWSDGEPSDAEMAGLVKSGRLLCRHLDQNPDEWLGQEGAVRWHREVCDTPLSAAFARAACRWAGGTAEAATTTRGDLYLVVWLESTIDLSEQATVLGFELPSDSKVPVAEADVPEFLETLRVLLSQSIANFWWHQAERLRASAPMN